jgi:hypothetical protein
MSEFKEIDDYNENFIVVDDDFNIFDIKSVVSHINANKLGFVLLLFVFIIIYVIDYINRINSFVFSITNPIQIPGVSNSMPMQLPQNMKRKTKKR